MVEPTLQEFVAGYGQERGLDVSTIVGDESLGANAPLDMDMSAMEEIPLPDVKTEVEKLRPVISRMTEGEMMNFLFDLMSEYNRASQEQLMELNESDPFLENY